MAAQWLFESGPLWLSLLVLFLAMGIASAAGAWLHRRTGSNAPDDADKEAEGYVLSGVLGLLALLVAFTFGMALNRFEMRRDLVVQEASALGVAYLRTPSSTTPPGCGRCCALTPRRVWRTG
jgi:hypothetical protein